MQPNRQDENFLPAEGGEKIKNHCFLMKGGIFMGIPSILAILFAMAFSVIFPIGIMLYFRKMGGKWKTFLIGAATFIVFAMILESILHNLIFLTPLWTILQGNIWLYGLYGGLAAGVFEETGRFLAFKLILKNEREPVAALSYGIGHGGAEAILLVGVTMVNNLVLAAMASAGATADPTVLELAEQLTSTPAGMFLWAAFERVGAIIVHVSLSVLVFAAVRVPGKKWLFPTAIGIHAAADFIAVVSNANLPVAATEFIVLIFALIVAVFARMVYRTLPAAAQENEE